MNNYKRAHTSITQLGAFVHIRDISDDDVDTDGNVMASRLIQSYELSPLLGYQSKSCSVSREGFSGLFLELLAKGR